MSTDSSPTSLQDFGTTCWIHRPLLLILWNCPKMPRPLAVKCRVIQGVSQRSFPTASHLMPCVPTVMIRHSGIGEKPSLRRISEPRISHLHWPITSQVPSLAGVLDNTAWTRSAGTCLALAQWHGRYWGTGSDSGCLGAVFEFAPGAAAHRHLLRKKVRDEVCRFPKLPGSNVQGRWDLDWPKILKKYGRVWKSNVLWFCGLGQGAW